MEDRSASVGKYLVTMDDLQFIVTSPFLAIA